jgi:hypothetical protein
MLRCGDNSFPLFPLPLFPTFPSQRGIGYRERVRVAGWCGLGEIRPTRVNIGGTGESLCGDNYLLGELRSCQPRTDLAPIVRLCLDFDRQDIVVLHATCKHLPPLRGNRRANDRRSDEYCLQNINLSISRLDLSEQFATSLQALAKSKSSSTLRLASSSMAVLAGSRQGAIHFAVRHKSCRSYVCSVRIRRRI